MIRTKIVCTLGPATSEPNDIAALVTCGMDVARINMAHGAEDDRRRMIDSVRAAARVERRPVAILADLGGPKIRVGRIPEPVRVALGDEIVMAYEGRARAGEIPTTYAGIASDMRPGVRVAVDDGLIELQCTGVEGDSVAFDVVRDGVIRSNQGINIPSGVLSEASLTEKDVTDLDSALELGVEYVGLSFVRTASDVTDLKSRVAGRALVVAKIEMACAVDAIDEILDVADAIMIARGDLGVELPFEKVPLAQKRIIEKANLHATPVITATQMLESMIHHARPTRAEASDVANAVLDGTDCVMLSGETAIGRHPRLAVEAAWRIVAEIEKSGVLSSGPKYLGSPTPADRKGASPTEQAIACGLVDAVRQIDAPAVLVLTSSGFSARLVSSHRPPVPIFTVTTDPRTYRQLAAVWGVWPVLVGEEERVTYETLTGLGKRAILDSGFASKGECVVVTAGVPFHESGTTNTLRVERL